MTETPSIQPGQRIAVVGTSGCGKTYVAKRLAGVLGVTYICNDSILWGPNWELKPLPRQLAEYDEATRGGAWTFDGNLANTTKAQNALVLERIDTLIWLDLPRRELFGQLLKRTIQRAWTKEPMWHGNCESWRLSFFSRDSILVWAFRTYVPNRRRYTAMFNDPAYERIRRIRFTRRREVDAWLAGLSATSCVAS